MREIHDTRWRSSQSHMSGFSSNRICSLSPGGYGSGSKTSGWTFANQFPVRSRCVNDIKPEKPVIPINAILFRSKFNVTRFSMSLKSPSGIVESSLDERSRLVNFFIPTKQFDSRIHLVLKTLTLSLVRILLRRDSKLILAKWRSDSMRSQLKEREPITARLQSIRLKSRLSY